MKLINKLISNPIFLSIWRSIENYKIEKKSKNVYIWYMSLVKNTILWEYTTIKNENIITNSKIWDYTYISHWCNINLTQIWKFCSIWQNIKCWLWKHPIDFVSTHPIFFSTWKQCQITFSDNNYYNEREEIIIWNDVWIWTNSLILDGVTIWNWAIIWACSLVNKDVPPYAIVWGVPAKIIKYRFQEDIIQKLLEIKWWDKDIEFLKENFKDFHNINSFIKKNI